MEIAKDFSKDKSDKKAVSSMQAEYAAARGKGDSGDTKDKNS